MSCLIDTGVLLRVFDTKFDGYRRLRRSLRNLSNQNERFVIAAQNVAEFWNVSARPYDKNGYGLTADRVVTRVAMLERFCEVATESAQSYAIWKGLLVTYSVTGVAVHDARLVSIMLAHGISKILTLNERDFRRYQGIAVLVPDDL